MISSGPCSSWGRKYIYIYYSLLAFPILSGFLFLICYVCHLDFMILNQWMIKWYMISIISKYRMKHFPTWQFPAYLFCFMSETIPHLWQSHIQSSRFLLFLGQYDWHLVYKTRVYYGCNKNSTPISSQLHRYFDILSKFQLHFQCYSWSQESSYQLRTWHIQSAEGKTACLTGDLLLSTSWKSWSYWFHVSTYFWLPYASDPAP